MNTFGYVAGNPIGLSDSTGQCPWCIAAAVGGAVALYELIDLSLSLYDVYELANTLFNDCISGKDKLIAAGMTFAGFILPGNAKAWEKLGDIAKGGAHGNLKGIPGNESHHMPADSVSPLSKNQGPAVSMEKADHRQTASWGNSKEARDYRKQQKDLIEKGDFRGAQQMDINDIQSKFGDKYDGGIQQMLDYTDSLGL